MSPGMSERNKRKRLRTGAGLRPRDVGPAEGVVEAQRFRCAIQVWSGHSSGCAEAGVVQQVETGSYPLDIRIYC